MGEDCLIALINTNDGKIKFANVGDSGLMILRPTSDEKRIIKLFSRPKPFNIVFNCPYQQNFLNMVNSTQLMNPIQKNHVKQLRSFLFKIR